MNRQSAVYTELRGDLVWILWLMSCGLYRYSPVSVPVVEDCEAQAEGCLSSEDAEAFARCLEDCAAESQGEARGAEQLAQDCERACALAPTPLLELPEEDEAPDP